MSLGRNNGPAAILEMCLKAHARSLATKESLRLANQKGFFAYAIALEAGTVGLPRELSDR